MNNFNSTDEKIIEATFVILQEEGFNKATTKKIAAKAGVNEVTIFRKFKNKNNLVEITKDYYLKILIQKLKEIFDFNEDDEIEEYLQSNFLGLLNLPDSEFSIIKVAMEEVRDIPEKKTTHFNNNYCSYRQIGRIFQIPNWKKKNQSSWFQSIGSDVF